MDQAMSLLQQVFGFDSFRTGQGEVVSKILAGKSSAAIFPTGAGKSLCYQLPALILPGLTIVVSPLLSLMHDQLTFLRSKGVAAAALDSTLTREQYSSVLESAVNGSLKILMISVERFRNERFRTHLSRMNVSLLVVDEAHCISEWGHNFRPEYLKLPNYRDEFKIPQVLLLTATATETVAKDMCEKLAIAPENIVRTGFYRSNLNIQVTPVEENQKIDLLIHRIRQNPHAPTIVYVTLQNSAEEIAAALVQAGIPAEPYHAGMENDHRRDVQNRFMNGQLNVVTATIAFGMGIDKRDIRRVIHFDLPKSIEGYSQEIGRAGRDGKESLCELFACGDSVTVLENFVYGDTPTADSIKIVLQQILSAGDKWEVKQLTLATDSNIRELPLKTLLVYLEIHGIITPVLTYFSEYEFKTNFTGKEIVDRFSGDPQDFLRTLLSYSQKRKTWIGIDIERFVKEQNADRKRAVAALEYLETHNIIELSAKQAVDVYRVNNRDFDVDSAAQWFANVFIQKEQSEVARIGQMIGFFEHKCCISKELAGYFGEILPNDCGHCSVCSGAVAKMVRSQNHQPIPLDLPIRTERFRTAAGTKGSAIAITRFLCGISSPLNSKLKVRSMHGHGSLERFPYTEVLSEVHRQLFG